MMLCFPSSFSSLSAIRPGLPSDGSCFLGELKEPFFLDPCIIASSFLIDAVNLLPSKMIWTKRAWLVP